MTHEPDPEIDPTIETDLARANLARLRGDYVAAEAQCVALMHRAPFDANAAALLGDISVERGNLEAAIEWYEMAIDSGAPIGVEEKLRSIQGRLTQKELATSEAEIGLPSRTAFSATTLLGAIVVGLMLLTGAFVAGTYRAPVKATATQDQPPILVPPGSPTNPGAFKADPTPPTQANPDAPASQTPSATPAKGSIDADLAPLLGDATGPLTRVTSTTSDPRSHTIFFDVSFEAGDDVRAVAAQVAEAAFAKLRDAAIITIRVSNSGKPAYMADATRQKYDAYKQSSPTAANGDELADALLSNEWKAPQEEATTGR